MTPVDAKDLFDNQLPKVLEKNPEKAKEIGAIYLFKITGNNGGVWTVDLAASTPTCKAGGGAAPQCTIEVTSEDFRAILGNPQMATQLYFQGRLKVQGDPMLAMKLSKLFAL